MKNPFADIDLNELDSVFHSELEKEEPEEDRFIVSDGKKLIEKTGKWIIWEFGGGQFLVDDLVTGGQCFYFDFSIVELMNLIEPNVPKKSFIDSLNERK